MAAQNIRARDRSRAYDIVLFGATGFAGKLTAQYLLKHYGDSDLRWAIAGRNASKLEKLRDELLATHEHVHDLPIMIADSLDRQSLDAITTCTSVVCSTVGPYARYGSPLVASCVAHGTDYCDLTGELHWVRKMMDMHHTEAKKTGARIVHCSGFDSIPSDLGVYLLQREAIARFGAPCTHISYVLLGVRGGFSGGSIATMLHMAKDARERKVKALMRDPYSLNPKGTREGNDRGEQLGVRYNKDAKLWTAPFLMEAINARIVRRSNALLNFMYGKNLRYSESMSSGPGVLGAIKAGGTTAMLALTAVSLCTPPVSKMLQKFVLPAPGQGPSEEVIETGFFKIGIFGRSAGSVEGQNVDVVVQGRRDPGYGATATMCAESALCLALQGDQLESDGGILTTAYAMGHHLVERLNASDVTFAITS